MSFIAKLRKSIVTTRQPSLIRPLTSKRCLTATRFQQPQRQQSLLYRQQRFYTVSPNQPIPPKAPLRKPSDNVFTWKSMVVLVITAIGLVTYFKGEKERLQAERAKQQRDKVRRLGKPNIGQPFELLNANQGKLMSSKELMEGRFTLIYFGFTHCPDICPEELDKMAQVVDAVKAEYGQDILTPVFITCDPLRDTEQVVKEYVADFHPDLIGFTGDAETLKQVARSYRVYSYTPPNVNKEDDYLVDHSIFFYLMDPEGKFVDCYARDNTAEEVLTSFKNYMQDYLEDGGKIKNYKLKQ